MSTGMPPSAGSDAPVMKSASSEARNNSALATTQAVPCMPCGGTRASRRRMISSRGLLMVRARGSMVIGVATRRSRMALARMPYSTLRIASCDHTGFRHLEGNVWIVLPRGDGLDHQDHARFLRAHDRKRSDGAFGSRSGLQGSSAKVVLRIGEGDVGLRRAPDQRPRRARPIAVGRLRSRRISRAALRPGLPETPPPGWVPAPHM
jgi:hypothetical protein